MSHISVNLEYAGPGILETGDLTALVKNNPAQMIRAVRIYVGHCCSSIAGVSGQIERVRICSGTKMRGDGR
jgi:hypothetical protein